MSSYFQPWMQPPSPRGRITTTDCVIIPQRPGHSSALSSDPALLQHPIYAHRAMSSLIPAGTSFTLAGKRTQLSIPTSVGESLVSPDFSEGHKRQRSEQVPVHSAGTAFQVAQAAAGPPVPSSSASQPAPQTDFHCPPTSSALASFSSYSVPGVISQHGGYTALSFQPSAGRAVPTMPPYSAALAGSPVSYPFMAASAPSPSPWAGMQPYQGLTHALQFYSTTQMAPAMPTTSHFPAAGRAKPLPAEDHAAHPVSATRTPQQQRKKQFYVSSYPSVASDGATNRQSHERLTDSAHPAPDQAVLEFAPDERVTPREMGLSSSVTPGHASRILSAYTIPDTAPSVFQRTATADAATAERRARAGCRHELRNVKSNVQEIMGVGQRSTYHCRKCGAIKKGHVCPIGEDPEPDDVLLYSPRSTGQKY